jgi:ABC-type antimicrobial peptide transport system permease subunit
MTFELRTAADPLVHLNTVRGILRDVNPLVAMTNVSSQAGQIDETISREIMFARICTAFAILALTIACVGLYGTVAYSVARRTSEIGIRVALGAQRGRVIRMVLKNVLAAVAVALVIGVPIALKASIYVESFLYSMKPDDGVSIAAAVLILVGAAFLAAFIPAHRASRIDPLIALRYE